MRRPGVRIPLSPPMGGTHLLLHTYPQAERCILSLIKQRTQKIGTRLRTITLFLCFVFVYATLAIALYIKLQVCYSIKPEANPKIYHPKYENVSA